MRERISCEVRRKWPRPWLSRISDGARNLTSCVFFPDLPTHPGVAVARCLALVAGSLTGMALAVLEANLTSLAFTEPFAGFAGAYRVGELVNVSWTTPFEYTTLELWEGSKEKSGPFAFDVLAGM